MRQVLKKISNHHFFLLLKAIRPRQWVKNLAVFAALIFGGLLFNFNYLVLSFKSFVVLCLLSSAAYLINDLADIQSDRRHPFKKLRPIASGNLTLKTVLPAVIMFLIIGLGLALFTSQKLLVMAILFLIIQLSYTFIFKKIPVIDALVIAGAYILRVYTGEIIIGHSLSIWLMLSVVSLSLFLSIAKRKAELALLTADKNISVAETRQSLARYSGPLLDIYLSLFATSTWITYGFYTFSEQPIYPGGGLLEKLLPITLILGERKWLMISIPFVLYGIMRYLQLIYESGRGESPEKLLFLDKNLLLTVIGWGFSVIFAIYLI
jgi:decaprenyl-phosphate phosphoribosyltransferase